tara:strand:- start:8657 stop:9223 length:567 start_codon:yes stop_codon:yes gene_type:complete
MKIYLLTLILIVTHFGSLQGQSTNRDEKLKTELNQEIKELVAFQEKVDEFLYAIEGEDISQARRMKSDILQAMKEEIHKSQAKVREGQRELSEISQKKGTTSNSRYSRNGASENITIERYYVTSKKDLDELKNRLALQIKIASKLRNLYLDNSINYRKKAREHEGLMHDFERTMKADIEQLGKGYWRK